jgi:hypothetical protein
MKDALTGDLANARYKRGHSGFPDIVAATRTSELPGDRTILQSICHAITLFTREMSDLGK